jgi:hypothetical protein
MELLANNRDNIRRWVVAGAVALAAAYATYQGISLWWVCDDAFISFRYAQNLVRGHGLVFNVGERVEGYTNFLWTMTIAAGMLLGIDPVPLSVVLGALFYFATAGAAAYIAYRLWGTSPIPFVPLAALMVLLHHDHHVYATSGLETSLVAFLVTLAFGVLVLAEDFKSYLAAGCLFVAGAMTRPDAMIFYVMAAAFVVLLGKAQWRRHIPLLLPLAVIYVPYWLVRYNYYGYPFPNTYYAKSASLPYYSQGLIYLWLYVKSYYITLLVPVALVQGWAWFWRAGVAPDRERRFFLLAGLFIVPYVFYVVRSGGDFMFARFFIPITPVLCLLLEGWLRRLLTRPRALLAAFAIFTLAIFGRWNVYADTRQIEGIADEPAYYPRSFVETARKQGERMREMFEGTDVQVAFRGMCAVYIYYSEAPVGIEITTGLTDTYIAHQSLETRGRPGHEKEAPLEYLLSRHVQFGFRNVVPLTTIVDSIGHIVFGDYPAYMVTYQTKTMERFRQFPDVHFVDFPLYLDGFIRQMDRVPDSLLRPTYLFTKHYYFDHNDDPVREQAFLKRLSALP